MKPTFIALLALCLCLPLMGADKDKEEFEKTKALAEKGDAVAQHNLGWMYLKGEGVEKDGKEAFKWYQKAADQGNAHAQSNLGWMYSNGEGVEKDGKEAFKWYRKAADQGNAHAQYFLGSRYYQGKGVLKDYVTAYAWWNIAAANAHFENAATPAATWKANIAKKMTPEQIAEAEALVKEMTKKNPKLAKHSMSQSVLAAIGVLSQAETPAENTSQGLYIRILKEAGMEARAVSAEAVKAGALEKLDIFIIGGGSGTTFSQSLGPDGGAKVEAFVKAGGGVLASCAGGYAFVRGYNVATRHLEIANAVCLDVETDRWERGKANVQVAPAAKGLAPLKMFYGNGPLWKITEAPGFGRTVALSHYVTDVKKKGDPGGTMPGTPAILAGTFGEGRYVLFSGHPEFYKKLGNHPMIVDAARWVVRRKLAAEEKIDYRSVFPSMLPDKKLGFKPEE